VQQQEPATAFQLLNQLLITQPEDPWLWTVVGRLQLQLGHVQHAEQSFLRAEQGFAALGSEQLMLGEVQRTVSHNNICLKIMALDLQGGPGGCGTKVVVYR
jgi:predicted Zn-dependent protease